ncbi:MAG: DUF2231 domain-containing protein [Acidobacteriota bacterium]|nr:DUF2231 domain-containing protein [Acidobacteriota bacterium]
MKARARIFGLPVHQILIVFPLGLLATSFFFDLAWLAKGRGELAVVASWLIFAGVVGGLAASLFGMIDWLAIPRNTRAWRVGAWHGGGNLIVAVLFAVSWLLRRDAPAQPDGIAIALSGCGVLLIILTGWLGSELADRMEDV